MYVSETHIHATFKIMYFGYILRLHKLLLVYMQVTIVTKMKFYSIKNENKLQLNISHSLKKARGDNKKYTFLIHSKKGDNKKLFLM